MPDVARQLLREAATLLDARPRLLRAAGGVRDFHDGARWMRLALRVARRERVPRIIRSLESVGWSKYARCCGWTALAAVLMIAADAPVLLPLCVPLFYAVEAHHVFDVPLAIDRPDADRRAAHRQLLGAVGGAGRATRTIMTIAACMAFGGLLGRGFVRSWCIGCAAVAIWYERARRTTMR